MSKGPVGREKGIRYEQWRNPDIEEGGVVRISGAFLVDHENDILNLIKHEGKLATERNNNIRITKIEKTGNGILVETTSHNLAMRIGKALKSAYKGEFQFKFREGEKFVEADWKRD
jgi:NMD protein affecting ribosome stability and mRNA decay